MRYGRLLVICLASFLITNLLFSQNRSLTVCRAFGNSDAITLKDIAITGDTAPSGGEFVLPLQIIMNERKHVAFSAYTNASQGPRYGIFLKKNNNGKRIAASYVDVYNRTFLPIVLGLTKHDSALVGDVDGVKDTLSRIRLYKNGKFTKIIALGDTIPMISPNSVAITLFYGASVNNANEVAFELDTNDAVKRTLSASPFIWIKGQLTALAKTTDKAPFFDDNGTSFIYNRFQRVVINNNDELACGATLVPGASVPKQVITVFPNIQNSKDQNGVLATGIIDGQDINRLNLLDYSDDSDMCISITSSDSTVRDTQLYMMSKDGTLAKIVGPGTMLDIGNGMQAMAGTVSSFSSVDKGRIIFVANLDQLRQVVCLWDHGLIKLLATNFNAIGGYNISSFSFTNPKFGKTFIADSFVFKANFFGGGVGVLMATLR